MLGLAREKKTCETAFSAQHRLGPLKLRIFARSWACWNELSTNVPPSNTGLATIVLAAMLLCWSSVTFAQSQAEPSRPTVRISSPFAAPVWRADVDAAEGVAVVSNAGKALTIWPLSDVARPLTARVPLRNEQRRRAHAVAISANSELVAYSVPPLIEGNGAAKPNSSTIYILRRATGKIWHVIEGAANDIATRPQSLKFSPDGVHLAAVLSSGCGVRLWTTRDWKPVFKDDQGYGGEAGADRCCRTGDATCDALPDTTGVQFLKPVNGQPYLVTAGDSGVRVYDKAADTVTLRVHAGPGGIDLERPSGIAASPDGTRLLIGDRRDRRLPPPLRLRLAVLDAATLKPIRPPLEIRESALLSGAFLQGGPQVGDINQSSLDRVAWLKSGADEHLFGAGVFPCEAVRPELLISATAVARGSVCMARWTLGQSETDPRFIPIGSERIIDVAALPRRQGLLIASQKRIAILDAQGRPLADTGRKTLDVPNTALDLRDADLKFRISPDGRIVELEDYRVRAGAPGLVTFDLGALSARAGDSGGAARVDPDQGRQIQPEIIDNWRNSQGAQPRILGREFAAGEIRRDEVFRAVAIDRDRRRLVLASSEFLRVVSWDGGEPRVLCREPVSDEAYRVNLTADGAVIVSGHSDGTLRWYRIHPRDTGCQLELLVTAHLSETADAKWTWAAWQPSGLYSRDMDSDLRLEWQRTGKDGQIQLTPFERLLLKIDRDAVRRALDPLARAATAAEVTQAQVPDEDELDTEKQPDKIVEVIASEEDRLVSTERAPLRLAIGEGRGWPKRLSVKLADESPLAKFYRGAPVSAEESVLVQKSDMVEGTISLDVLLPPKARAQANADFQMCFFVDDAADACHQMKWTGALAPPPPRRLWALIIGVSKAREGSGLDLRFPQNDAIDLARLFVTDHERRVKNWMTATAPDFSMVHIDLAVSAFPAAEAELAALAAKPYVARHFATKAGIAGALQKAAQAISALNRTEPGDDLFLMAFSGHGLVDPFAQSGSAFLTADSTRALTADAIAATTLRSSELLHLLRQIPARKVIILDACRSLAPLPNARPFSPERIRAEFEKQALDAHFFFSSDAGQESFELRQAAFDTTRPPDRQGNGLFTFALLNALTTPRPNAPTAAAANRIEIPWIADFLRNGFFDRARPDSPANKLRAQFPADLPYVPEPKYIAARSDNSDQLIRTIEK
jgi:Caspase domain